MTSDEVRAVVEQALEEVPLDLPVTAAYCAEVEALISARLPPGGWVRVHCHGPRFYAEACTTIAAGPGGGKAARHEVRLDLSALE